MPSSSGHGSIYKVIWKWPICRTETRLFAARLLAALGKFRHGAESARSWTGELVIG